VTALTGLLTRGRYTATFTILSAGAYNTPVTVPVTFDVGEPALAVSPGSLAFATTVGTSASKTVSVSNSADGDLELPTVSSDRAWLGATVSGDSAPFTVTVTVDESLDAGSYSGSLTIDSPNASNGPLVVPVSVSVRAGKVSCYSAANSVCHEISTTLATNAASFSESCTLGGDTLSCPPTTLGPCTGLPGMTGPEYTASVWFYAPEFSAATAQLFCTVAEGTWDGPVDGGSTHFVSFGCNVPADLTCVDVSGTMTQATEDEWKTLCTDPGMGGGTIVTSCSTSNRIGTCSYTQSNVNLKERYYSGSGATAGDCSGTWTPG